jgi:hypothetical protein
MNVPHARARSRVEKELLHRGLLLEADAALPSVVSMIAGEPVRGSWWGHPKGHDIFAACQHLVDHEDVVVTKLVSGKVTFVHRELWAPLLALATCGEPWQVEHLSSDAESVLADVRARGPFRTDQYRRERDLDSKAFSKSVLELERRLLVHADFHHTEGGHHAKVLGTWEDWAAEHRRSGGIGGRTSARKAKELFELLVDGQNGEFGGRGRLPWQARPGE